MNPKKIYTIIVAAGLGSRFGNDIPKQYCYLNDRPILMHTIDNMHNVLPNSPIILVINKEYINLWNKLCIKHSFDSPKITFGGETRWESVKNAIGKIPNDAQIIIVHDGVRPLVSQPLINRILLAAEKKSGAIPVIPVTDSLCQILSNGNSISVNRNLFRTIQTPQAFCAKELADAYNQPYKESFTDDFSTMIAAGYTNIALVNGDPTNIKITHPIDLEIASTYMKTI